MLGLASHNGELWAVGGYDGVSETLASCERLDAANGMWVSAQPLPLEMMCFLVNV